MKLLYTGASYQGAEQLDPSKSLGHIVSGTQIPNDQLNNLFPSVSTLSIQGKRRDTKMIALYNDEGEDTLNLSFTFNIPTNSICKYKIAFVTPTLVEDYYCFEELQNSSALPYKATFQNIVNGTVLTIAELLNEKYLGMWITREFDFDSEDLATKSCSDWEDLLENPVTVDTTDHLSFDLYYSLDSSDSYS